MAFSPATWIGNQVGFSDEAMGGAALGYAVGGPVGGAVGFGLGNSVSSAREAKDAQADANAQNIAFAQETNNSAIELANTAHQREVRDLQAAGLNPILSSKYGGSATPSLQSPKSESLAPTILNSAKQTNDLAMAGTQVGLQASLQKSQTLLNSAQAVKAGQEAQRVAYENDALAQESKTRALRSKNDEYEASRRSNRPSWQKDLGIDVHDTVGSVLDPVKRFFTK